MLRSLLKNNPILALLALGVAAGGIFLWQRGDFSFTAQKESQEQISDTQLTEKKEASNETDTVQAVERRSTIDDILVDIEPLLAGGKKGDVQRFWFAQNEGVYVEYETREGMRMACKECKNITRYAFKNRKTVERKLEFNKYCRFCRRHTLQKETKRK